LVVIFLLDVLGWMTTFNVSKRFVGLSLCTTAVTKLTVSKIPLPRSGPVCSI